MVHVYYLTSSFIFIMEKIAYCFFKFFVLTVDFLQVSLLGSLKVPTKRNFSFFHLREHENL